MSTGELAQILHHPREHYSNLSSEGQASFFSYCGALQSFSWMFTRFSSPILRVVVAAAPPSSALINDLDVRNFQAIQVWIKMLIGFIFGKRLESKSPKLQLFVVKVDFWVSFPTFTKTDTLSQHLVFREQADIYEHNVAFGFTQRLMLLEYRGWINKSVNWSNEAIKGSQKPGDFSVLFKYS